MTQVFWDNRTRASNMQYTRTRIPDVPDQSPFLDKWYEYHRGYRITQSAEGHDQRIELHDQLEDVPLGLLPGQDLAEPGDAEHTNASDLMRESHDQTTHKTIEDFLDDLFDEEAAEPENCSVTDTHDSAPIDTFRASANDASTDVQSETVSDEHNQISQSRVLVNTSQATGTADVTTFDAIRSQLSAVIEPLQALTMTETQTEVNSRPSRHVSDETWERLTRRAARQISQANVTVEQSRLASAEAESALDAAQSAHNAARTTMLQAKARLRNAQQELNSLQRARSTADNHARVFGTSEDVEQPDYVSPVANMFNNAWSRYRNAQQAARDADVNADSVHVSHEAITFETSIDEQLTIAVIQESMASVQSAESLAEEGTTLSTVQHPLPTLDAPTRPEPKDEASLTVKLECKVCYTQVADTVCLPCGHLVMCNWCADQHCPSHKLDKTRPAEPSTCPLCKKNIRQRVKLWLS